MEGFMERQLIAINQIEDRVKGHKDWLMSKKRCRFTFEEITALKFGELRQKMYKKIYPCDNWVKREAYYRGVNEYEYIDADYVPIKVGDHWGAHDVSCFFKTTITVPEDMDGEKLVLQIFLGGDSLLYVNGKPYQGLDPFRNSVCLSEQAKAGDVYDIYIESYCYHTPGAEGNGVRTFECCSLVSIDKEVEKIYWDYMVAFNLLAIPDMDAALYEYVKAALNEAVGYIDIDNSQCFAEKLAKGSEILNDKIFNCDSFKKEGQIHLVGHSHLDIIYLWEYKEFVRKVGRTHATMLRLLDENPEFVFSQSQAVTYREMRDNYPELFERVKEYVKEGRWEIIGAMWVEPDCNLISGESFVRQIMLGKKFFQKEFGIDPKTCWLPDVFGNSFGMPQILAKSGIEYFVTHKPCVWNDTNPIPKHTFWWEGPDGSRVFAALSPTHFVGTCEPNHVMDNWNKFSDKTTVGESMYCYGWGDGGGGVSPDMIENAKRMKNIVGMPKTKMVKAEDALDSMKANAHDLPVLKDEIYLEAHRGVHTTHAKLKKLNRTCENMYREAEMYAVIAGKYGYEYPAEILEKGWEYLLTNQFHDILPGTHVKEAYGSVVAEYEKAIAIAETIKKEALAIIAGNIKTDLKGRVIAVFNSLEHEVDNLVYLDETAVTVSDEHGNVLPTQVMTDFYGNERTVFVAKKIPAVGYSLFVVAAGEKKQTDAELTYEAENDFFTIRFDDKAEITEIYDKREERNVLKSKGNVFRMYQDVPSRHDAWDIVSDYKDRPVDLSDGKVVGCEKGDVFTAIVIEKQILSSTLKQKIVLYNEVDRIDFITNIDWKENQKLLKVGFDVDVAASRYTSDIAYATIERATEAYNSYDEAKFEVSAHNWIDMSEEGYGVSILNDCKYGYDVKGTMMNISLLKAPISPDVTADRELHDFTYALYPHKESWRRGGTVDKARAMNNPATIVEIDGQGKEQVCSFVKSNRHNVTVEAVKNAEDGDGIIIRVLERCGIAGRTEVTLFDAIAAVTECDLMEHYVADGEFEGNKLNFRIGAYEIKSFRVKLA